MTETFSPLPTAPRVTHPETKPATRVEVVAGTDGMAAFQRVPELVYWADPYRIRPILADERALFDTEGTPAARRFEMRLFTAWHGHGQPVGRVGAFVDPAWDERTGERYGFFGLLEFMNDARLPEALLAEAVAWLRARGAKTIVGPVEMTPWRPSRGVLVEGFYDDPVWLATYTPPSYPGFVERLGLETWTHDLGYELALQTAPPEGLLARAAEVAARDGLAVRRLDLSRLEEEWELLRGVMDAAHEGRARRPSVPRVEWDALLPAARKLLRILPEGGLILEERGRPVGCALAFADWNRVLKHQEGSRFPIGWIKAILLRRTIDRVRVHELCVAGAGRGRALPLVVELWRGLRARRYTTAHIPGVPEDHERAKALLGRLGAKRTRGWRMWRVPEGWPGALTPHRDG